MFSRVVFMDEYVTHGQLVEVIELLSHMSFLDAFIAVMVYDLLRQVLGKVFFRAFKK